MAEDKVVLGLERRPLVLSLERRDESGGERDHALSLLRLRFADTEDPLDEAEVPPAESLELVGLLSKKVALDAEVDAVWQQLKLHRIAAIRGGQGDNLEPLPQLGLDELQRASQEKQERRELENFASNNSPEHRRTLAEINRANAEAAERLSAA
jgi:hypothetical protein